MQRRLAALGAASILSLALMPATGATAKPPSWVPPEGPPPITDPSTCKPNQKNCTPTPPPPPADTTAPTVTVQAVSVGEAQVSFTASEAIDPASVTAADFVVPDGITVTSIAVSTERIGVTLSAGLDYGESVTLLANSITDLAGNPGPAADVTTTVPNAPTPPADTTGPTADINSLVAGATSFTIVFNEAIDSAWLGAEDVFVTSTTAQVGSGRFTINGLGTEVTVHLEGALSAGDVVGVYANSFKDATGNSGPAQDVTETVAANTSGHPTLIDAYAIDANGNGRYDNTGTFTESDKIYLVFSEPIFKPEGTYGNVVGCCEATTGTDRGIGYWYFPGDSMSSAFRDLEPNVVAGTSGDADFQTTGLLYPITITSIENFVDADGNPVNLAGSTDTLIDVE